ncbi:MAG: addiction module antitoxin RelB [Gammaproteobacteria bacterium HGW-Gammaproteobacteria-11]|nr:MAG: addiction module antitoxin RelB [Gammaproteobacteria bacterium HGW-Gammaproteobacteria-11]
MDLQQIQEAALSLPREHRVILIERLLLSLDLPLEQELRSDWLLEARRRADELDALSARAVPAKDVMRKARTLTD